MDQLHHGGDWAGYEREYGAVPLDFSANVSPLGLPEGVRAAAEAALQAADRYPDPLCRALRERLADYHGTFAERIVCGAGAADLIWRLALTLRPKRALVTAPTFSEYERALSAVNCRVRRFPLREAEGFAVTERILDGIRPGMELLFLCNPNNPTGRLIDPELLARIYEKCAETGTVLALDECFLELTEEGETRSLIPRLAASKQLVVLRAFTKTYAMAGLRLGYALCGDPSLAERLRDCGQPWAVSAPAEAAGRAALEEAEYLERLRRLLLLQRRRMAAGLGALGFTVIPGAANFLLFRSGDEALCEKLRGRGILLRSCADFPGLGPGWYRTAVRAHEENEMLLRALKEVLSGG